LPVVGSTDTVLQLSVLLDVPRKHAMPLQQSASLLHTVLNGGLVRMVSDKKSITFAA
jgi:hypothetical protein